MNRSLDPDPDNESVHFAAADSASGLKIGPYEILEESGGGSAGIVYRAWDSQTETDVVLRVSPEGRHDQVWLRGFLMRGEAAARVRHAAIVPVLKSGVDRGRAFLVSRFVSGRLLSDCMASDSIDFRTSVDWIRELADKPEDRSPPAELTAKIKQLSKSQQEGRLELIVDLLSEPGSAVFLADALREKQLPESTTKLVLTAAKKNSNLAVRDLFEPFVPASERVKRLGDSINPGEILALKGDISRGRQLFHVAQNIQCRNCHRIGKEGKNVGPELTQIGKKNDRAKLLESILEPSKNIDPKFITWLVETTSGRVHSGLLVKKDGKEIIILDAQNKEHRFAADDVEGMFPQRKSLMPELLLKEMTAQQVADLLTYLASLK